MSMVVDSMKITGRLRVKQFRNDELVKDSGWMDNVITTAGKNALASLLNSASAGTTWVSHIGYGTSATAVNASDTTLGAEASGSGYARASVTRSNPSANVIQYVATLQNITASITFQEAGLFNASTAGTLVAHQLLGAPYTLAQSADSLQITWQITIN